MAAERICAVCKADCSTSERLKDKKGRYFHKGCYERAKKAALAKQKRAQAAATPTEKRPTRAAPSAAPMAVAAATPAVRACPNCNAMMAPGAVLCTTCGFNAQTGQIMQMISAVQFDNSQPKKQRGGGSRAGLSAGPLGGMFANPAFWLLGSIVILGITFATGFSGTGGALLYYAAASIFGLAVYIWVLVDAFRNSVTHGVLCIVLFCIYPFIYVFFFSENNNLKAAWVISVIAGFGSRAVVKHAVDNLEIPDYYDESFEERFNDEMFEVDESSIEGESDDDASVNDLQG